MLFNRIQATSSLFTQTQFNFATKNLKAIKLRMKAVESIKKITKVHLFSFLRPWRWSLPLKWEQTSQDSKKLKHSVLVLFKKSLIVKLSFKRKNKLLLQRNGFLSQLPLIKVSAVVSTQVLLDKLKLWLKPIEALIKSSSLVIKVH